MSLARTSWCARWVEVILSVGRSASAIPTATTYNVYRGVLSLKSDTYYGSCFLRGLPVPTFTDTASPPLGEGYFYLVTGVKDGIEGLLGFKMDGVTPLPNNSPCP